jgi:hypothetical protein
MMSEFKQIFLQPECCVEDQDVERMWCQDAINDCEEGNEWIEYTLSSDVNQRIAELEKALKNLLAATDGVYSNSPDLAQAEGAAQEALKEQTNG